MMKLDEYLTARNNQLNSDETLHVLDSRNFPDIDHFIYEHDTYKLWDCHGKYYEFTKRDW